jgi:hypothetical protein
VIHQQFHRRRRRTVVQSVIKSLSFPLRVKWIEIEMKWNETEHVPKRVVVYQSVRWMRRTFFRFVFRRRRRSFVRGDV